MGHCPANQRRDGTPGNQSVDGQGHNIGVTILTGRREYVHPEVGHNTARLLISNLILADISELGPTGDNLRQQPSPKSKQAGQPRLTQAGPKS